MKGSITITFSAKEAVAMLSSASTPKSLTNKIVKAFREADVTPAGAKNAVVARATPPKKSATKKTTTAAETSAPSVQ